jgi:hypothetical protein
MALYGYKIVWDKGASSVEISGCPSPKEAYEQCVQLALICGWTAPKWWQVWKIVEAKAIQSLQSNKICYG